MLGLDPGVQDGERMRFLFHGYCEERRGVPRRLDCRVKPGNDGFVFMRFITFLCHPGACPRGPLAFPFTAAWIGSRREVQG